METTEAKPSRATAAGVVRNRIRPGADRNALFREIELLKISLASEEIRGRFFAAIGAYFGLMIAIIAASFELNLKIESGGPFPSFLS